MSRILRRALTRLLVPSLAMLGLAAGAFAYFSSTGTGGASVGVTTLTAPSISSATPGAGTVALSWTAVSPPGAGSPTYYVTRDGGLPAGNCPTSSSPSSVTSCTDSGLSVATHTYTVTAVWASWTAKSSTTSVPVTYGAATQLVLTPASTTPSAGASDNLTITVKDASGNTVLNYTGSHSLTFGGASTSAGGNAPTVSNSSGTAKAFGSATAITFNSGVAFPSGATNGVMTLYKAQNASITVTDGSISNGAGTSVTVSPLSAAGLGLSLSSSTPTAGAADNLTIAAIDNYGNADTTYTGSHNLTFTGAHPIGAHAPTVANSSGTPVAFGGTTAITFASGVSGVTAGSNGVMTLYKAETTTISVSDGTLSSNSQPVTVSPGTPTGMTLSATTSTPSAGASDNLTLTVIDTYGNVQTGYSGAQSVTFSGAHPIGAHSPTVTDSSGSAKAFGVSTSLNFVSGVASVTGSNNGVMTLYDAETATIVATVPGPLSSNGLQVTVAPGGAQSFSLAAITTTPTAGAGDNLTITAQDTYGNTATVYTGTHQLMFGGASTSPYGNHPTVSNSPGQAVAFGTAENITFNGGIAAVSGSSNGVMTLYTAQTASITVTDGTIHQGSSLSVTVSPGAAASISYSVASTTPVAGSADNVTVWAVDNYGNTATSYTGLHNVTFSGANPIGPNTPTVTNSSGTAVAFGTATQLNFVAGVSSVSGTSNGVMKLYKAETAGISANGGSAVSVTVSPAAQTPFNLAYVDQGGAVPDQVTGTTTANVNVTATQTAGDHVGNTYNATATVAGSFTITVEAYNGAASSRSFTYSVVATDPYGNQTSAGTVTATDTK